MAIFCLATSISDLKERLSKIVCAYTYDGKPVTAGDIGAAGAMTALLKDALDPNLVQTLENNPAIIHGGPLRQHRPRLQQRHGHQAQPLTGRLRHHRGRLRRRSGRREVPGHQVPLCGYRAQRLCAGGDPPGSQEPRRRSQGRPEHSQPRGRQEGAQPTSSATSTT